MRRIARLIKGINLDLKYKIIKYQFLISIS
jgi:hypothetical protein